MNEVVTWTTGCPVRVGFGRGVPEHDPWRFEAGRLVEAGEVDAALWVSALRPLRPTWDGALPIVALVSEGGGVGATPAEVLIEVGVPGIDHDAVLLDPWTGALAQARAQAEHGGNRPTVAHVLERIEAQLDGISGRC